MSVFSWSPSPGPTQSKQPRVKTAQFGDGYQQRVADGINGSPRSWALQFTRLTAEIDAIDDFLSALGGAASFEWMPPKGAYGKWVCRSWSRVTTYKNVETISATFEEVFGD